MKKAEKIYKVSYESKQGSTRYNQGTLSELVQYYSYTLEIGNSWNKKINRNPKTIDSLINNYNKSIDEKCGGYYRPYLTFEGVVTAEEKVSEINL